MLKRKRKINKAKLIESSRQSHSMDAPVIPLPMAYASLLAAGVPKDKAVLMVQDAATRASSDATNLWCVVVWDYTPYSAEWRAAAVSRLTLHRDYLPAYQTTLRSG